MFSYQLYNLVHVVGLVLLMLGMGGLVLTASSSGGRGSVWNLRLARVFHALGVFLILLGGFGMMARLGIVQGTSWPGWISVKMGVWATLGVAAFIPHRFPRTARPLLLLMPVLAGLAVYMAIYKPV